MVSPFQGRQPTQQPFPPANRQPFNWGVPYQQGPLTETTPEKTGIQGILQKLIPSKSVGSGSAGGSGGISGTLDNIQQILKMSQSVTPLIQQYAPMVKNLPAMLTLLKAFQESDELDDETTTQSHSGINESTEELEDEIKQEKVVVNESKDDLYQIETEGHTPVKKTNKYQTSKPKLYI